MQNTGWMKRATLLLALAMAVSFGVAGTARAQDDEPLSAGDKVVYKKRTTIDLTGAVIEGELTRPEGSYIVNRKISRFSKLVRIRSDYVPELLDSANEL